MAVTIGFVLWGVIAPTILADTATSIAQCHHRRHGMDLRPFHVRLRGPDAATRSLAVRRIRLGRDDERPEFSTVSWISMMFATGHGHRTHLLGSGRAAVPPAHPADGQGRSRRRPRAAAARPAVHGLPLGPAPLGLVRRRRHGSRLRDLPQGPTQPARARSCSPRSRQTTPVAGQSTSSGCSSPPSVRPRRSASGAIQINSGLTRVFDAPTSNTVAIVVIASLTAAFVVSAVSGTAQGDQVDGEHQRRPGSGSAGLRVRLRADDLPAQRLHRDDRRIRRPVLPDELPHRRVRWR